MFKASSFFEIRSCALFHKLAIFTARDNLFFSIAHDSFKHSAKLKTCFLTFFPALNIFQAIFIKPLLLYLKVPISFLFYFYIAKVYYLLYYANYIVYYYYTFNSI